MRFRIDLKILIFIIAFYFTNQIKIYACLMFFAFLHEMGHLLTGLFLGMKPEKLEIMPFGISISFRTNITDYNKKIKKGNLLGIKNIIVAFAGPITNLIIIIITYHLKINIINQIIIIYTNILLMIFNLLPIYPLDGGRIVNEILHINFGLQKSEKYMIIISNLFLILITILILILTIYEKNFMLLLIIAYLWYLVIKENIKYKNKKVIYKKILENKTI